MLTVLGTVLFVLLACIQAELHVGFTDVDYQDSEDAGCIDVVVSREGGLSRDLVISIHPMTYRQFADKGLTLPDQPHFKDLPDPAEYEHGRKDFSRDVKSVTLLSGLQREDHRVCIEISNDNINEDNEGFLLVLSVDEQDNDPELSGLIITRGRVALGLIMDDDKCIFTFERPSYVFSEEVGHLSTEIALVRNASVQTEVNLTVSVTVVHLSATPDEDYTVDFAESVPANVWFKPGTHRVALPISIAEDDIPEIYEQFQMFVSATPNGPPVTIPDDRDNAIITIADNDVVSVGFDKKSYVCTEGDLEGCQMCVSILSPDYIDEKLFIFLSAVSVAGTAQAEEDFAWANETVLLFNMIQTMCFPVSIQDDRLVEGTETFQYVLSVHSLFAFSTLNLEADTATVTILDNDMVSVGFEQQSYTCKESQPESCVLCVAILNSSQITESLAISLFTATIPGTARAEEDYVEENDPMILSVDSKGKDQRVCMSVYIWDDDVAEREESFACVLSYNDLFHFSNVYLQDTVATVTIQDDDVVFVGFERDSYTCTESDPGSCEVCVSLLSFSLLDDSLSLSLFLTTISETAEVEEDFIEVNDSLQLSNTQQRVCVSGFILDDSIEEGEEFFICILTWNTALPYGSFSNVNLQRVVTTIAIRDDDNGVVGLCLDVDGNAICHERAICYDELEGGVQCKCTDGYIGDGFTSCTDVNECVEGLDDCDHNTVCATTSSGRALCTPVAFCDNTDGSYRCTCSPGYSGDGRICTDVDECTSGLHHCDKTQFCHYSSHTEQLECVYTASCINTEGGHACHCNTGFTGDGTICLDIDECTGATECSPNAHCHNIPGSHHCKCNEGFQGDGILCTATALSDNECSEAAHSCNPNADCINTEEGLQYKCQCQAGFTGDGYVCMDVNECSSGQHGCSAEAECVNTEGSYECHCQSGREGDGVTCSEIQVNECSLGTYACQPHSDCVDEEDGYSCVCQSGYRRDDTNVCVDIDECVLGLHGCSRDAECINDQGSYYCVCTSGYEGDGITCSDINECIVLKRGNCSPSAECENSVGSYFCRCVSGYEGDGHLCTDLDECALGVAECSPDAECENSAGSYDCHCRPGFKGDGKTCAEILVDECSLGTYACQPNSDCVDEEDGYSCVCQSGYRRADVDLCVDIDECKHRLHDCETQASCVNTLGGFQCTGSGTTRHATSSTNPCDSIKSRGYALWRDCLIRLRPGHHDPQPTEHLQTDSRESTGILDPARLGPKGAHVSPWKGGEQREDGGQEEDSRSDSRTTTKSWQSKSDDGEDDASKSHFHTINKIWPSTTRQRQEEGSRFRSRSRTTTKSWQRESDVKPWPQKEQRENDDQQDKTLDRYEEILDSWSELMNRRPPHNPGTKPYFPNTKLVHHGHSNTNQHYSTSSDSKPNHQQRHRHKPVQQRKHSQSNTKALERKVWLSSWPYHLSTVHHQAHAPEISRPLTPNTVRKQSSFKRPGTKPDYSAVHASEQNERETYTWFRMPAGTKVKLTQHSYGNAIAHRAWREFEN